MTSASPAFSSAGSPPVNTIGLMKLTANRGTAIRKYNIIGPAYGYRGKSVPKKANIYFKKKQGNRDITMAGR
ncbi:MAG TPA: hypothetical protein PK683_10640 [Leptospiraceae bacterium]|nr:hypothetical protein [Leptospiraceae bacterium]